mgnify:CR=1 FL=1
MVLKIDHSITLGIPKNPGSSEEAFQQGFQKAAQQINQREAKQA